MKQTIAALLVLSLCIQCNKNKTEAPDVVENSGEVAMADPSAAVIGVDHTDSVKTKPSGPVTTIALSAPHHDFGDVKKGEKVSYSYEIINTGNNPLVLSEVKPGCGCTAPEFTKEPILPGKSGKVTLSFDSSNFDGMVNKSADVFANVEKSPIRLTFSANVK